MSLAQGFHNQRDCNCYLAATLFDAITDNRLYTYEDSCAGRIRAESRRPELGVLQKTGTLEIYDRTPEDLVAERARELTPC